MSRKRLGSWVLVLVVGLATRTTLAAPQATIDGIRAAACCADHCPAMPRAPLAPHRCCLVGSPAGDQATVSGTAAPTAPADAAVALVAPAPVVPAAAGITVVVATVRAGPVPYLRNRSLRL